MRNCEDTEEHRTLYSVDIQMDIAGAYFVLSAFHDTLYAAIVQIYTYLFRICATSHYQTRTY